VLAFGRNATLNLVVDKPKHTVHTVLMETTANTQNWPTELHGYTLVSSGELFATYKSPDVHGTNQSIRIMVATRELEAKTRMRPAVVQYGTSVCKMKADAADRYLITRSEVFGSVDRALAALRGDTETKGKKTQRVAPMTDRAYKAWEVKATAV
jgi:hypothetical protein